jgi:hypothetical protein
MTFTRISDNLFDSSLWSDSTAEGAYTLKLWLAILGEARTRGGRFSRLTPAKAARIAAMPLEMATTAIQRLVEPDAGDSSGVAEGRRLVPDPDGGPNDFIITNWQRYGRDFERASNAERQRRHRLRHAEDNDQSVTPALRERDEVTPRNARREGDEVDQVETKKKTTPSESKKKSPKDLVEALTLDVDLRAWCADKAPHLDAADELDAFKERMRGNGYRSNAGPVRDARAAFQTHIRNAVKYARTSVPQSKTAAGGSNVAIRDFFRDRQ